MADLNIIERANKILTFRKYIREECRKKGLEYPSDEKIAEYINDGCAFDVNDFMGDYENKIGIFRDPFVDFMRQVNDIEWGESKPTEEEVKAFVTEHGYDFNGFVTNHTINSYKGIMKETLVDTLKLSDVALVLIWNRFIEESAMYGEDSYIYDLKSPTDVQFINNKFPNDIKAELTRCVRNANIHNKPIRFFQWHNLNDNKIYIKNDIKGIIVAYWSDIFTRIIGFPNFYDNIKGYDFPHNYFSDTFWPVCAKMLGYSFDKRNGKLIEEKK